MSSSTGSDAPGEDDAVFNFYQANQLRLYIASAGLALLFFEYLITFNRELCYVRDHKRTWAKAMFILNRYISLFQAFVTLFSAMLPVSPFVLSFPSCVFLGRTIEVCQISLYAVWAVFSALRVYALSNNNRVAVAPVALLSSAPVMTFIAVAFAADYEIDVVPYAPYPSICHLSYYISPELFQQLGILTHVPLILAEALVIVVTFVRTWNVALSRNVAMVQIPRLVLKEGVLYFLAMLLVNSTQIISNFLFDPQFTSACSIFNLLVPILVSRFYLNLHDVRKTEDERKAEERRSDLEMAKSSWKGKPLPQIPEHDIDDTKIFYINEVFQHTRRVLGRGATCA
ncbi:hypothetical protein LXA43DRAFT_1163716 [Ganoderma leucocontextum]|nr:hypothetical protein LXA43DRAFT_1163716 [Ganoderma leucocontextum]